MNSQLHKLLLYGFLLIALLMCIIQPIRTLYKTNQTIQEIERQQKDHEFQDFYVLPSCCKDIGTEPLDELFRIYIEKGTEKEYIIAVSNGKLFYVDLDGSRTEIKTKGRMFYEKEQ